MEFKQLECFVKVVEKKSFSKASESLYISQPAVTSNIQKLEKLLKSKLINRNGKEISLTKEGKILYSYANELLNLRSKAVLDLDAEKKLQETSLIINASTIPAQYILPKIIKDFKTKHSNYKLDLTISSSRSVARDILEGRINIGFTGSTYSSKDLQYFDIFDDELVMISSKNIKLGTTTPTLEMIKSFELIVREDGSGTRKIFEEELKKHGQSLAVFKSVSENQNSQSIKTMVELGCGIAFVSKLSVKNEVQLGILNSYSVSGLDLKRKFKMVLAKNRHFSPAEQEFKNFILQ